MTDKKINILFICKYNKFRSRIAEAYFNKINKNKNIKAESAGIFQGNYSLNKLQVSITKKFGINIIGKPKSISTDLLIKTNLIIIVANDVPSSLFEAKKYKKKIIIWKIKDEQNGDIRNIKKIINQIIVKVNKLNKDIERGKIK